MVKKELKKTDAAVASTFILLAVPDFQESCPTEAQPAKTVKKTEAPKEKASPWVTTVGKRTLGLRCVDPVKSLWFPSQI